MRDCHQRMGRILAATQRLSVFRPNIGLPFIGVFLPFIEPPHGIDKPLYSTKGQRTPKDRLALKGHGLVPVVSFG